MRREPNPRLGRRLDRRRHRPRTSAAQKTPSAIPHESAMQPSGTESRAIFGGVSSRARGEFSEQAERRARRDRDVRPFDRDLLQAVEQASAFLAHYGVERGCGPAVAKQHVMGMAERTQAVTKGVARASRSLTDWQATARLQSCALHSVPEVSATSTRLTTFDTLRSSCTFAGNYRTRPTGRAATCGDIPNPQLPMAPAHDAARQAIDRST